MERGDEVCAVVDRDLGAGLDRCLYMPVVGVAVLTLNGEYGDPRLNEVGGDVVLRR